MLSVCPQLDGKEFSYVEHRLTSDPAWGNSEKIGPRIITHRSLLSMRKQHQDHVSLLIGVLTGAKV